MAAAPKRFIPIARFCEISTWDLRPERIRGWIRSGLDGQRPPFRKIGGRYFLDAVDMERWLNARALRKEPEADLNADVADYVADIINREETELESWTKKRSPNFI